MSNYLTRPGDTISKITEKFNTTSEEFGELNDIKKLRLMNEQVILIPQVHHTSIKLYQYITKENDNLQSIINTYGVIYEEIEYFNNLLHLILEPSQTVLVEKGAVLPVAFEFENG